MMALVPSLSRNLRATSLTSPEWPPLEQSRDYAVLIMHYLKRDWQYRRVIAKTIQELEASGTWVGRQKRTKQFCTNGEERKTTRSSALIAHDSWPDKCDTLQFSIWLFVKRINQFAKQWWEPLVQSRTHHACGACHSLPTCTDRVDQING